MRCFRAWLKWVPATMCGVERVEMLCKSLGILRPAGQRPICRQLAAPGHSNQRPATSSRAFLFMATIVTVAASKEHDTGWSTPHLVGTGICGQIISRAPLSLPPGSSRSPPGGPCHSSGWESLRLLTSWDPVEGISWGKWCIEFKYFVH